DFALLPAFDIAPPTFTAASDASCFAFSPRTLAWTFAFSAAALASGVGATTLYVSCPVFSTLQARARIVKATIVMLFMLLPPQTHAAKDEPERNKARKRRV